MKDRSAVLQLLQTASRAVASAAPQLQGWELPLGLGPHEEARRQQLLLAVQEGH